MTAYTLGFGSLLLLGGRLSDLFGRRRILITGLVGFAVASAVGGTSQSFNTLIAGCCCPSKLAPPNRDSISRAR